MSDSHLGEHSHLTSTEIEIIVVKAVRQTLMTLGVDLSTSAEVRAVQSDFAYMRRQRIGAENIAEWFKKSIVVIIASGALYALWAGIRLALAGKGVGP